MMDWVVHSLPWWVWGIPIAAAVGLVFHLVGVKGGVAAIIAGGLALFGARQKQAGYRAAKEENERDAWEQVNNAENARAASYRDTDDPERLRENDGYRRE